MTFFEKLLAFAACEAALVSSLHAEVFTTNAVCSPSNCVNPVFPGMQSLSQLGSKKYRCYNLGDVQSAMGFCSRVVNYNVALPAPVEKAKTALEIIQEQEAEAQTQYVMHLAAIGREAWDYQRPWEHDECTKSIWRLLCYTYLPKAPKDCGHDEVAEEYLRPCSSSCQSYVRACNVQCCDESVQCAFEHKKQLPDGQVLKTNGYSPEDGPSLMCTGAASRKFSSMLTAGLSMFFLGGFTNNSKVLIAAVATFMLFDSATALNVKQKTTMSDEGIVPTHTVGKWRQQPDYLLQYEFIPPGKEAKDGVLNSCSVPKLAPVLQCSGHGSCQPLDPQSSTEDQINFCKCDTEWADPECRTKRKSQAVAYTLSLFFGYLGADSFYLGQTGEGFTKLVSLGGFGFLWLRDVVKLGGGNVYAGNFRLAADLPHWAFVFSSFFFVSVLGIITAGFLAAYQVSLKRKEALLLQQEEEAKAYFNAKEYTSASKQELFEAR